MACWRRIAPGMRRDRRYTTAASSRRRRIPWAGTDATQVMIRLEGTATAFVAVDHFVGDRVGIHAARPGTRFEALEPVHQGLREHFGPLAARIATGLVLRHDNGPQYVSDHFQQEVAFLGMESSPSFVQAPRARASPSAAVPPDTAA